MKRNLTTQIDDSLFNEVKELKLKFNYLIKLGLETYKEKMQK